LYDARSLSSLLIIHHQATKNQQSNLSARSKFRCKRFMKLPPTGRKVNIFQKKAFAHFGK